MSNSSNGSVMRRASYSSFLGRMGAFVLGEANRTRSVCADALINNNTNSVKENKLMQSFNKIIIVLLALTLSLFAVSDSFGQITNEDIYRILADPANIEREFISDDQDEFVEDILFPPDFNPMWDPIPPRLEEDAVYTLVFPEGISVTFTGSLTIQINDDDAIGRIQAIGTEVEPITMDEAVLAAGWGGIVIETGWDDYFGLSYGNVLMYCNIKNIGCSSGEVNTALTINGGSRGAGAYVSECRFELLPTGRGFRAISGDFVFRNNVVLGGKYGMTCEGAGMMGNWMMFHKEIKGNTFSGQTDYSVFLDVSWAGSVVDNHFIGLGEGVGLLSYGGPDKYVHNNDFIHFAVGARIQGEWLMMMNNRVSNCVLGIDYAGLDVDYAEVHHTIFYANGVDVVGCSLGDTSISTDSELAENR